MNAFSQLQNAGRVPGFRKIFTTRDLFVHDGNSLRRLRVDVRVQAAMAFVALALIAWSIFSAWQLSTSVSSVDARAAEIAAMEKRVARMQAEAAALKRQAAEQAEEIEAKKEMLAELVDERFSQTAAEVRRLGLNPARFVKGGMGGPLEPVSGESDPQFRALFLSWKKLDQLEQGVVAIPSSRPVSNLVFTSMYGVRSDPFRGGAAMHAGVDIPGPIGTPIYATADGVVRHAGWRGGYGNLIEVSHGRGIETRYGHLSRILVRNNSRVERGDLIGYMGSTGRSTGSHLHYEVRIDGKAVNPMPFLQSSDYLVAVAKRADESTTALGGPDAN